MNKRVAFRYPLLFLYLGFVALSLSFLLPGHYTPWSSFEQEALAFTGLVLLGFAALTKTTCFVYDVPPVAIVATLASSLPLFQRLCGIIDYGSDAILAAVYIAAFAFSVCTAKALIADFPSAAIKGFGIAILIAGIASTGLALAQWLKLPPHDLIVALPSEGRPYGNLGQPNHLSTLLALAVLVAILAYELRYFSNGTAALVIGYLAVGIIATQSRTGLLFVGCLGAWFFVMRRRVSFRMTPSSFFCGICIFGLISVEWFNVNSFLMLSSSDVLSRVNSPTAWLRWHHWATLLDAISIAPWFGYGWQQVPAAQQATILLHPATGEPLSYSHNFLLDLLVWNGLPIGMLLIGALAFWFWRQVLECGTTLRWTLLAGIGTIVLHSALEYPLAYAYFLIPLGLMMGFVEYFTVGPTLKIRSRALFLFWCVLSGMLFWLGVEYRAIESAVRAQRFALMRIGAPVIPPIPNVKLLDFPRELYRFWMIDISSGMSTTEMDGMRRLSRRSGTPPIMFRYALAAALNGQRDEARDTLRKLCKMHPIERCEEGAQAWKALGQQYPELRAIEFPPVPPELIALRPAR